MRFLVCRFGSLKISQGGREVREAENLGFRIARPCKRTAPFPHGASRLEQQKTSRTSRPPRESHRLLRRVIRMEGTRDAFRGATDGNTRAWAPETGR